MASISFGRSQIGNPTPTNVSRTILIFTIVAGCIATWLATSMANFIPANVSVPMQGLLTLFMTIANAIKPLFGVETEQKRVPIGEVSEMEVKDDKP